MNYRLFTSESVCAGHPDKICDQISDAIVDAALEADPYSRVAVETAVKQKVFIFGELTSRSSIDFENIARKVIKKLGYTHPEWGFSDQSPIEVSVFHQSADISLGVDDGGAGDQGMMFGYAVNETPQLMPLPIVLAHELAKKIDELKSDGLPYLRPDGKTEFAVRYDKGRPVEVVQVVIAVPHDPSISPDQAKQDLLQTAVQPLLSAYSLPAVSSQVVLVNGTGRWEVGGPAADSGLTGRKIIVDSYGGMARVGGGAFSGKDPTKVDRSGAYAARYVAKNIVAAGLADRCEVQIAYAIGQKKPVAVDIETFGTEKVSPAAIHDFAEKLLDLSVGGILEGLKLRKPIYAQTAAYGHFGKAGLPWEKIAFRD